MYPTLEKVKEIAASGEYRRIPVCKELYADRYTPVEVMRVLRKASKHCYLLESASQTEVWGRFSFLGYEPAMEITCTDGFLNIRKTGEDMVVTKKVEHPGDTLREIIEQYKTPVMEELPPFTGGLVGYFSYDYIKYSEQKLKLEDKEQQDFRDMDLMLFDQVIAFDHYRQKVLLIAGVMTDDLEASYQKAEGKLVEMAQLLKTGPHMEFEKLKKIIAEVLNVDEGEITMETTFVDDLGADSLDVFQIIMGIEDEFDIQIPDDAAESIVTVNDAVVQIQNATNK